MLYVLFFPEWSLQVLKKSSLTLASICFIGACESATDPAAEVQNLSSADVQFLADQIDILTSSLLDDVLGSNPVDPSQVGTLHHEPIIWNHTFEKSRACHGGGTLIVAGTGTKTWDSEDRTYDVDLGGTKTREQCAHTRSDEFEDVVITLTGVADWMHDRHYLKGDPSGEWVTTWVGSWNWSKSTGTSGHCTYDIVKTIDTDANTKAITGVMCGNEVNKVSTWKSE